jgi:hypothetical protein
MTRSRFPTLRELKIIATTDFPFPESAWVDYAGTIAVGDHAVCSFRWTRLATEGASIVAILSISHRSAAHSLVIRLPEV